MARVRCGRSAGRAARLAVWCLRCRLDVCSAGGMRVARNRCGAGKHLRLRGGCQWQSVLKHTQVLTGEDNCLTNCRSHWSSLLTLDWRSGFLFLFTAYSLTSSSANTIRLLSQHLDIAITVTMYVWCEHGCMWGYCRGSYQNLKYSSYYAAYSTDMRMLFLKTISCTQVSGSVFEIFQVG